MQSKSIIHILNFDFENNQPLKNRYFIVLENDGQNSLMLSVITSQDHVPDDLQRHGCIIDEGKNIHCYLFEQNKVIGEKGFSFKKKSFIYINSSSIRNADLAKLRVLYGTIQEKDIILINEYEEVINCIYKSKFIARGIKRKLEILLQKNN